MFRVCQKWIYVIELSFWQRFALQNRHPDKNIIENMLSLLLVSCYFSKIHIQFQIGIKSFMWTWQKHWSPATKTTTYTWQNIEVTFSISKSIQIIFMVVWPWVKYLNSRLRWGVLNVNIVAKCYLSFHVYALITNGTLWKV
jgi:hypothetical protein